MADIFVSYASADREWVKDFVPELQARGWSVWWDRKIPVGKSFHDELEREIEVARCVLVVWTVNSVSSDWVRTEAEDGKRRGILAPVVLGDPRIPLGFRSLQAAQLAGWSRGSETDEFRALLESLKSIAPFTAKSGSVEAFPEYLKSAAPLTPRSETLPLRRRNWFPPNVSRTPLRAPSPALAAIIGSDPISLEEALLMVLDYIRMNELDYTDHFSGALTRYVRADAPLGAVFGREGVLLETVPLHVGRNLAKPEQ